MDLWVPELVANFEELKQKFKERPIRAFPQYHSKEPFLLDCDWSIVNFAAILNQVQDSQERFIGSVAKKCSEPESRYCSSFKLIPILLLLLRR